MRETIRTLKQAVDEVETVVWATCEFGSLGREKINVLVNKLATFKEELREEMRATEEHFKQQGIKADAMIEIKQILGDEKHE